MNKKIKKVEKTVAGLFLAGLVLGVIGGIYNNTHHNPILGFVLNNNNESFQGATKPAVEKTKAVLNFFSIKAEPIFSLVAPDLKLIPLSKLSTYQGKQLPTSLPTNTTSGTGNIGNTNKNLVDGSDSLSGGSTPSVTPNPIQTALYTFKPKSKNPEDAVFNIFCSQKLGKLRKTITGSSVLINSDGTLLTNAHVAQFPLVAETDNSVVCIARSGLKAEKTYGVKAVFISPDWSKKNAPYINNGGTTQTGENDYAFLRLVTTDNLDITPVSISFNDASIGSDISLISYPADILAKNINATLTRQKESLQLLSYYSFNTPGSGDDDALQTSNSQLAQHGSSGGLIIDSRENLIGIVSIITASPTDASKMQIRAITPNHINRAISAYYSNGLQLISQNGSMYLGTYFDQNQRSALTSLFLKYLSH